MHYDEIYADKNIYSSTVLVRKNNNNFYNNFNHNFSYSFNSIHIPAAVFEDEEGVGAADPVPAPPPLLLVLAPGPEGGRVFGPPSPRGF